MQAMMPFPMGELEWVYQLDYLTREPARPILGHMARPVKVTAASMRQAQGTKLTAWNAELARIAVGASASAFVGKLEGQLQLALESPRPRTFVSVTHRFENFQEPRTVLGETFLAGELLLEMRNLLLAQTDAAFDKGRNFNLTFNVHADGMGVGALMTWAQGN